MHTSTFFRLFPPPKFLMMKHAGLDISDEAIRCLEYHATSSGFRIDTYAKMDLPSGLIEGGDIRNDDEFVKVLREFNQKNRLSYVKVSIPEEKAYLFQADVPSTNTKIIRQRSFVRTSSSSSKKMFPYRLLRHFFILTCFPNPLQKEISEQRSR
jgi:Tfp pilus assembly PilM family ATPase